MVNAPTSFIVPGPEGPEPWAAAHHGRFRVPDFGENRGHVSFGAKMSADGVYYVRIHARFSAWDEATADFTLVGSDVLAYGPAVIGDTGGEFGYRATMFFQIEAPEGATHWEPVVQMFEADPGSGSGSGLDPGAKVRIDNFYVPDNGYPISSEPYLDGDQTKAVWEGPRASSTSIYGPKVPVSLTSLVTIEEEFIVGDGPMLDLEALTYLDDDLTI
jgi:hypothetical protein